MTEPINLNRIRKERARAADKTRADRNSVKFGRSKAEKSLAEARNDKSQRDHNGHEQE